MFDVLSASRVDSFPSSCCLSSQTMTQQLLTMIMIRHMLRRYHEMKASLSAVEASPVMQTVHRDVVTDGASSTLVDLIASVQDHSAKAMTAREVLTSPADEVGDLLAQCFHTRSRPGRR